MVDAVGAVTVDGVGGGGSMVDAVGAVIVVAVGGGSTVGDSFTQCIYQSMLMLFIDNTGCTAGVSLAPPRHLKIIMFQYIP